MKEYLNVFKIEDYASVHLEAGYDTVCAVGEELEAIYENAYMNGYNWAAVIECYLENNAPELLEGYDPDPEADQFVALYSSEDAEKADKLAEIIERLIEDKETLFDFVREHGDDIEWD